MSDEKLYVTVEGRRCERCGTVFAARAGARYCSTRCRVAAHRARQRAEAPKAERGDE